MIRQPMLFAIYLLLNCFNFGLFEHFQTILDVHELFFIAKDYFLRLLNRFGNFLAFYFGLLDCFFGNSCSETVLHQDYPGLLARLSFGFAFLCLVNLIFFDFFTAEVLAAKDFSGKSFLFTIVGLFLDRIKTPCRAAYHLRLVIDMDKLVEAGSDDLSIGLDSLPFGCVRFPVGCVRFPIGCEINSDRPT